MYTHTYMSVCVMYGRKSNHGNPTTHLFIASNSQTYTVKLKTLF